jgi:hypothetical protein
MPAPFKLQWSAVARWTWYQPLARRVGGSPIYVPRRQPIRDGDPRLVGELILAGIIEGV